MGLFDLKDGESLEVTQLSDTSYHVEKVGGDGSGCGSVLAVPFGIFMFGCFVWGFLKSCAIDPIVESHTKWVAGVSQFLECKGVDGDKLDANYIDDGRLFYSRERDGGIFRNIPIVELNHIYTVRLDPSTEPGKRVYDQEAGVSFEYSEKDRSVTSPELGQTWTKCTVRNLGK